MFFLFINTTIRIPINAEPITANGIILSGNVLANERWDGVIHDYQTCAPQLILTCPGYFGEGSIGTIRIPIKYCPECGRKLGKQETNTSNGGT